MPSKPAGSKTFTPSKDVTIESKPTPDGGEIWDAVISNRAMLRLAKAAGVSELEWLREPLAFLVLQLHWQTLDWVPLTPAQLEELLKVQSASRTLQALLSPKWITTKMKKFEARNLGQRLFGTRGVIDLGNNADVQKTKEYWRTWAELKKEILSDKEAVTRVLSRVSAMLNETQRQDRPAVGGALNLQKRYIADCALTWWTHLGHDDERSKDFIAFADQLYRLAGQKMKPGAIGAQLGFAIRRRDASAVGKRSRT